MNDRISQDFSFFQTAIRLREQRQQVLAANIANADTPNYKARDFEFKAALDDAAGVHRGAAVTQLSLTSGRHIPAQAGRVETAALKYRLPAQASLDGNTVDMDVERVQFAENSLKYQADLTLISHRIKTMMLALQP